MSKEQRSEAYDKIDRFLRNNLYDTDYAEYSDALECLFHPAGDDAEQDYRGGPALSTSAPYLCRDGCGCMWRDNGDGTMSLLNGSQKSCDGCERLPLSKLKRMTVHDNLFIDNRGDGVWLVCLDKVHSTMEEARRACRAWIWATTPRHLAQPANTDSVPGSPGSESTRPSEQDAPGSSIGLGAEGEQ